MDQSILASNLQEQKKLNHIRTIIAVAAGKGGVGKSSVAVNLALTLQRAGYQVGILDADMYGPSLGVMMPLQQEIRVDSHQEDYLIPGVFEGVKVISIAYLRPSNQSMAVRAPVVNGLIVQCIQKVVWGELDYLIVDFPPGTGDIQLTLMQIVPFSGAVLVTTPQEVAILDVQKAAHMFHQMEVPIVGVIENMSYFEDPNTGFKHRVFGEGGGMKIEKMFGIPLLAQIPIDPEVSKCSDLGIPLSSDSLAGKKFQEMTVEIQNIFFEWESRGKEGLTQFELIWEDMS